MNQSKFHRDRPPQVAILAGGMGGRFARVDHRTPKPLAPIGGKPILWHLMKHFRAFGFQEFVIATGYRSGEIRNYFATHWNASARDSGNGRIGEHSACNGSMEFNGQPSEDWKVQLIDTGESTPTGSRLKKLQPFLRDQTFMLTWCDGLANVNLHQLLEFHRKHGKLATVTAVRPPARFGSLTLQDDCVIAFHEKRKCDEGWINGAFFVLEPPVFDYIQGNHVNWERGPLVDLARDGQLMAFRHHDFWQCMDTVEEQQLLEDYWQVGKAPWKIWN
jgi:glucose-1-phosphate cytidylyltransferase